MLKAEKIDIKNHKKFIISMTIPVFVELILLMLLTNVDQVMISAYAQSAVASIGNAEQILYLALMFCTVFSNSVLVLVSQYKGAGDIKSEQTIYSLALVINTVLGAAISIALFTGGKLIFSMMNVQPEALPSSVVYLKIVGGTFIFQTLISLFNAFLKSNAMMKQVMYVSVGMNVLNVIGNYLLIFGKLGLPELGVAGAAYSTAGSRVIGLVILVIFFLRRVDAKLSLKLLAPFPTKQLKKMLYIGVPGAVEPLSYNLAQVFMLSFINVFGIVSVNTYIYITIFARISMTPVNALRQASQVVIGRQCGAGERDEAQQVGYWLGKISALVSLAFSACIFIFSRQAFSIFTSDPAILRLGRTLLMVDMVRSIGRAFNLSFISILQSVGDVIIPTTLAIISGWVISVGGGYLLGVHFGIGLLGLYIMITADELVRGIFAASRWHIGRWKKFDLLK